MTRTLSPDLGVGPDKVVERDVGMGVPKDERETKGRHTRKIHETQGRVRSDPGPRRR